MDRTPYHLDFSAERIPDWLCPECGTGRLTLDKKSLLVQETAESEREHTHEAWEPDWTRYVFGCVFECSNSLCKERVGCTGTGKAEVEEYEDAEYGWVQHASPRLTPLFFSPHLRLIDIPSKCPDTAVSHLLEACALYFADPGAAMNCTRAALEAVVTDLGVRRFVVRKGRRIHLSLHQRLKELPVKFANTGDLLMAVKWLGNTGSHAGEGPSANELRVTFDLLEHALSEIYEPRSKRLAAVARKVIKARGRVSPKI